MDSGWPSLGEPPLSFLEILTPLSTQSRFCCVFTKFFHLTSSVPTKPRVPGHRVLFTRGGGRGVGRVRAGGDTGEYFVFQTYR